MAISVVGADIPVDKALDHVFGYAVGLDMTRRDLGQTSGHGRRGHGQGFRPVGADSARFSPPHRRSSEAIRPGHHPARRQRQDAPEVRSQRADLERAGDDLPSVRFGRGLTGDLISYRHAGRRRIFFEPIRRWRDFVDGKGAVGVARSRVPIARGRGPIRSIPWSMTPRAVPTAVAALRGHPRASQPRWAVLLASSFSTSASMKAASSGCRADCRRDGPTEGISTSLPCLRCGSSVRLSSVWK